LKHKAFVYKLEVELISLAMMANVLFSRHKFFTMKIQKSDDLLQHINKVKTLADQLEALNVPVTEDNIVINDYILEILTSSFENFIVTIETKDIKELTLALRSTSQQAIAQEKPFC